MKNVVLRRAVGGILAAASLAALPVAVAPSAAQAVQATVPNQFVRDCSNITRRCTGFWQANGAYNPRVPSSYTTRWVWRWI
jgi:hypothetical protein